VIWNNVSVLDFTNYERRF